MGTDVILLGGGGGGNPAMHKHPVQGGEAKFQGMLFFKETGLSSGHFAVCVAHSFILGLDFLVPCKQSTFMAAF